MAAGFKLAAPPGARLAVRVVQSHSQSWVVERDVVQPRHGQQDRGAMVTVWRRHGVGYCATADLSDQGLQGAVAVAHEWACLAEQYGVFAEIDLLAWWSRRVERHAMVQGLLTQPDPMPGSAEVLDVLRAECAAMSQGPHMVHTRASLTWTEREQWLWWDGVLAHHSPTQHLEANLEATAQQGAVTQTRTLGGQYGGVCLQGGWAALQHSGLMGAGGRLAHEARQLAAAPVCPAGPRDLLLMPDQMMLQIHESIGHPLELDRILGDERNFAGGSFVRLEDFGRLAYGSPLLNVRFDPTVPGQAASYAVDDEGEPAQAVTLIHQGVLQRALGGGLSRLRAAQQGVVVEGTANARATGWYRPAIDRMGNINLEPGNTSLAEMVAGVERGVLMQTNASWSIDDRRHKFQFGCEWGQLIEDGRLTQVVRNPGYRGVSSTFWHQLAAVGTTETYEIHGTPFCGKGEPGQVVRVGHAAPACLFRDIAVMGGQEA